MIPGKHYTVEEVRHILWRRSWIILLLWVVVAIGTLFYSRSLQDRYRSESLIQVVPPRVPGDYVRSPVTARLDDRLPVISQQILSRTKLERILQDFGLYAKERKTELMEDVIKQMRYDIGVQIVKGDAFVVRYDSDDPRTAMKVTEQLASLFVEENLRDREVLAEGTNQFLESQLDEARRQLLDHEKRLEEYRREHSTDMPAQLQSNMQAQQNTYNQLQTLQDGMLRDRDRRLMLQRIIADTEAEAATARSVDVTAALSADTPLPPGASSAAQLEQAKQALQALLLRLTPQHPDIVRLRRHMEELEKKAAAEALQTPVSQVASVNPAEAMRNNRLREAKTELENLDALTIRKEEAQTKLQSAIGEYQRRIENEPTRETELIALNRDYDTMQRIYTSLLMKSQEAKAGANLERRQIGEQFKVIDPARLPERPFSPDRSRISIFGAVGGLLIGLGLVALIELTNTSFRTEDDIVSALSLPVLATISVMLTTSEKRAIRRRRLMLLTCTTATVVLCGAAAVAWRFRDAIPGWWR